MMLNLFFVNVYNTSAVSFPGSVRFRIFSFFSYNQPPQHPLEPEFRTPSQAAPEIPEQFHCAGLCDGQ